MKNNWSSHQLSSQFSLQEVQDYQLLNRDVVQPPVFVTAALKRKEKLALSSLSTGHVLARRSRRYITRRNTKVLLCQLHEMYVPRS